MTLRRQLSRNQSLVNGKVGKVVHLTTCRAATPVYLWACPLPSLPRALMAQKFNLAGNGRENYVARLERGILRGCATARERMNSGQGKGKEDLLQAGPGLPTSSHGSSG